MRDVTGDRSKVLVERASRGDREAVERLLAWHFDGLRAFVHERAGPGILTRESSSDIAQSACREVLEALRDERFEYRGEAAFKSWLYQAALRKIVDRARHHGAAKRGSGSEAVHGFVSAMSSDEISLLAKALPSPSGEAMLHEELERLARAFDQLSDHDRTVVRAVAIEGLTHARAGERLGCTEAAARKAFSRALAKLSRILA